ncbi:MAG: hypothetical protein M0D57_20025 [Sphingobacteriales bacterium JAD_PAG50586_3]|nr:MAG: hypothetical protein M0D57_20025 [Sphingobacteriales bacterium JAD_PAG50586_3]
MNPKMLADKGVFEKDGRLFYEPYLKEEESDKLRNSKAFFGVIDKGISLSKTKKLNMRIALVQSKESFLSNNGLQHLIRMWTALCYNVEDRRMVIQPGNLLFDYTEGRALHLEDYLVNDSHLNSSGNIIIANTIKADFSRK